MWYADRLPGAQSRSTNLDQIAGQSVSGAAVSGMIPVHRGTEAAGASARRNTRRGFRLIGTQSPLSWLRSNVLAVARWAAGISFVRRLMMTATECRRQSELYMDEAKEEDHTGIRTVLLALNRTCITMANQIDRLADLREEEREP